MISLDLFECNMNTCISLLACLNFAKECKMYRKFQLFFSARKIGAPGFDFLACKKQQKIPIMMNYGGILVRHIIAF